MIGFTISDFPVETKTNQDCIARFPPSTIQTQLMAGFVFILPLKPAESQAKVFLLATFS